MLGRRSFEDLKTNAIKRNSLKNKSILLSNADPETVLQ